MKHLKSAMSLALAAAACLMASAGANAQSMEVVTVEAVREVIVGKSTIGAPIKEVTIRSRVSYADLDLTTEAGSNELTKRIKDTATSTCGEIKVDVPVAGWTEERCIKAAIDGAMGQAKTAVDAAKAAKK